MDKKITLNHITKIEGHAKLNLGIKEGAVEVCELSATEGARYFEGIVRGRQFYEAHEMTSRICGICSCGHVIAAIQAVEDAIGYEPSEQTVRMRKLLTLGERIRSHATHLYFLALPDYLGYESALAMAPKFKKELKVALTLMKLGNDLVKVIGGRDLHPVSATVGGWLKIPNSEAVTDLKERLRSAKDEADRTVTLFSTLEMPDFSTEGDWFSLMDDAEYAMLQGRFGNHDQSFEKHEYRRFIDEYHQDYSTANFVVKEGKRYMLGALSRLNNNHEKLSDDAKGAMKKLKIPTPSTNPYHNNLAQAVELVHAIDHAITLLEHPLAQEEAVRPAPKAGTGVGSIEVPRGTLWHEYTIDEQGVITNANIITPTAQNLLNMQEDIRERVPALLSMKRDEIVMDVEKLIRSYDPCFSCSAHFLEVNWQ